MKRKPTVLGLLFRDNDPSATLIRDGEIAASVEEERFSREKHACGAFPIQAVHYCLSEAGITLQDVDTIAVGWDAAKFPVHMARFYMNALYEHQPVSRAAVDWQLKTLTRYSADELMKTLAADLLGDIAAESRPEIRFINHHFCHAASSFMVSGFDDAVIVTADGHGEDDCTNIWVAEDGRIRHLQQWLLPHSLGWFYTKFTQWFGFRPHDGEGKLMGLAAYGKPDADLLDRVHRVVHLTGGERVYEVNSNFFWGNFVRDNAYTQEWLDLFGEPLPRESKEPFSEYHKDLAYAVQDTLEEVGLALVDHALSITGKTKVCTGGGTFMNCKMNGVIARRVGLENFFVQPIAGDNGISLGAALAIYHDEEIPWTAPYSHVYFGPSFSDEAIEEALKRHDIPYERSENICRDAARLIAADKVVGWFQGRMEGGARALGNRSILGNPLNPTMSNIINTKVKFREPWRPFCPSVLFEDGNNYFEYDRDVPFMIVATDALPGMAEKLPSVVHVDNTVRVQTVRRDVNKRFYELISEFKKITGVGVVLNTSFNIKGEPIACTPEHGVKTLLKTGMDVLAIGDFLAYKPV